MMNINFSQTIRDPQNKLKKILPCLKEVFHTYLKNPKRWGGIKFNSQQNIDLNILIVGKKKIKKLNHDYRDKNKITDVLSFGIFESLRKSYLKNEFLNEIIKMPYISLGDIIICNEVAKKQACEFSLTYEEEVLHLIVHGFLHLLGFDHELSDVEEAIMEKEEAWLLKNIAKKLRK